MPQFKLADVRPKMADKTDKSFGGVIVGLCGILLVCSGIVILVLRAGFVEYLRATILTLRNDSIIVDLWKSFPEETPVNMYFFNWTNHEDFLNDSSKPKFREIGPYKTTMKIERTNLVWNDNNDTVTFNQVYTWHYAPEGFNGEGNYNDNWTTINYIPLLTAQYVKNNLDFFWQQTAKYALFAIEDEYHISRTIDEHIFTGYQHYIIDAAHYFPDIAPEFPRMDRFGLFRFRNGSENFNGIFNMKNGVDGNFEMTSWNYENDTHYFDEPCSRVKGSLGDLNTRSQPKKSMYIFISDVCRPLRFDYETDVYVKGLLGHKYTVGDGVLDNGTLLPENSCFCKGRHCLPYGAISVSTCRYNIELFVSLPQFHRADSVYTDNIEGLNPQKDKHDSYIIVEPNTMLPLQYKLRAQLNILAYSVEDVGAFSKIPRIYFPLVWMECDQTMPDFLVGYLNAYLALPIVLDAVGILLVLAGIGCFLVLGIKKLRKIHDYAIVATSSKDVNENLPKVAEC